MNKVKCFICFCIIISSIKSFSQSNPNAQRDLSMDKTIAEGQEYDLIKSLTGKWNVEMKTWNDTSDKPVIVANYKAERTMQGHFLEEIMQTAEGAGDKPFKRIVYLNYNYANYRWEYIVLDTRYPVMMFETSMANENENKQINLYLPAFVMPPGLIDKNGGELTKQHRIINFITGDKTVIQQYWTIPGGKEFLAIQYTYTREKQL